MIRAITAFVFLLLPCLCIAQNWRTPVYVSHNGHDRVGQLFETALRQELSKSERYAPRHSEKAKGKFEFHIDLTTAHLASDKSVEGKRSVVSVVIEDFRLPNGFPVYTMWYHEVLIVDRDSAATVAKDLLYDMDARWCSHVKDSIGGCPQEKFAPKIY